MSTIRLAVFDLDGTLVHLEYEFFHSEVQRVFPLLGVEAPPAEKIFDLVRHHQLFHCFPEHQRAEKYEQFWQLHCHDARPPARLITGALETLESLVQDGYEVAIATARTETVEMVRAYLEPASVNHHINIISTFVGQTWSDKTFQLQQICEDLGILPANAMMVGDAPSDIVSARKAGFALAVAVLSGESSAEILSRTWPHRLIEDVREIPAIIRQYHENPGVFALPDAGSRIDN